MVYLIFVLFFKIFFRNPQPNRMGVSLVVWRQWIGCHQSQPPHPSKLSEDEAVFKKAGIHLGLDIRTYFIIHHFISLWSAALQTTVRYHQRKICTSISKQQVVGLNPTQGACEVFFHRHSYSGGTECTVLYTRQCKGKIKSIVKYVINNILHK